MSDSLPAIILCGGLGTRLQPVVSDRPKVLADVGGRPFLGHLLDHLAAQGIRDVILSAGHMADLIRAFVDSGAFDELLVRVIVEESPLGTAGALRYATEQAALEGDFLALNGDTFFSGSLGLLARQHARLAALATIALARVPDAGRYGSVQFDEVSGAIVSFSEKGSREPGWINAGVYMLRPEALDSVPAGAAASLERDVLPTFVGRGLAAVPFPDATFLDIGTPEDYMRAELVLSSGTAP